LFAGEFRFHALGLAVFIFLLALGGAQVRSQAACVHWLTLSRMIWFALHPDAFQLLNHLRRPIRPDADVRKLRAWKAHLDGVLTPDTGTILWMLSQYRFTRTLTAMRCDASVCA